MPDPLTLGGDAVPNLAVDLQPDNAQGVFVLDSSELDGPDVLGWEGAGGWLNVVCDVQSVQARRGASRLQGILTRTEAGTATVVARDDSRQLDPLANGEQVHRGTPARLRAWGFDSAGTPWGAVLFTGTVDTVTAGYARDESPTVTLELSDVVGTMTGWEAPGRDPAVGAGDTLLARVQRLTAECGVGAVSTASDATFAATLAAGPLARPWEEISDAADAELGRVWVDAANLLAVRARGSELSGPVRGSLSDVHGQAPVAPHCCMADPVVVFGTELLTNRAVADRRTVSEVDTSSKLQREDTWSVARYGPGTVTATLDLQLEEQLGPWAEAVVLNGSRPELRVDSVRPVPAPDDAESAADAWPAVCATDIGDRWRFLLHPVTGPAVDRTLGVLGIELDLTPDAWQVTWTTTEAPTPGAGGTRGWFVLDSSELDSGDLLAPYSQPLPA